MPERFQTLAMNLDRRVVRRQASLEGVAKHLELFVSLQVFKP